MSKDKTLEELKKSLKDNLQSIQEREELNEEQRTGLKDGIKIVFEKVLLEKYKSKEDLNEILNNQNKFLRLFSPWHQVRGEKLIKDFVKNVNQNSTEDFSWLNILDEDNQWNIFVDKETKEEVKDESKHVNMRYQIPTHFHGDIDNAVLFYCMENPRGYIKDSEMDTWAEKQMLGKQTIDDYYKYTAELRNETWKNETTQKIIKERYNLNGFTPDSIEKIIYSNTKDETPLRRELNNMFSKENKEFFEEKYILKPHSNSNKPVLSKKYYYIARYYAQLLEINGENLSKYNIESDYKEEAQAERDKAIKISEKICNVEIYPFSSSEPKLDGKGIGNTLLLKSDLSRLGVYIILRRIYRYLDNEAEKPVIIFRKYDSAWEKLFIEIFDKVKDPSFDNKMVLSLLEKGFFYCQTGQQGGGITEGNIISVRDFKAWKNIYEKLKKLAFTEISELLLRVDIDKVNSQKAGD